ncbi:PAS domain S-box protein [Phenylobacterium sp.]|uniref:PAS domain S-box protein n=1 Tax=Phenylobacterium sp. TaxID=1871053 RepID=UPI002E341A54|nr:PAS domain S-box protein [Phenylobacterium sp.]HEX2560264.1 PAS domain S-box protein [Phenylobacterium sp.]
MTSDGNAHSELDRIARQIIESATDFAIITTDLQGRVTSWNPGAEAIFGWTAADIVGELVTLIHTPEDQAAGTGLLEFEVAQRSGRCQHERWRVRKDGQRVFSSGVTTPLKDPASGQHLGFLKVLRDRTSEELASTSAYEAEQRGRFLLNLTDLLRRDSDTSEVLQAICAFLGEWFGVNRVGFGHVEEAEDLVTYEVCWTDGLVPPLLGEYPASAFGAKVMDRLRAGLTVAMDDVRSHPLTADPSSQKTSEEVDTRAVLVTPLFKAGRLRTIVYLNQQAPRRWTSAEIVLMEEVAERSRELIERARAEEALRTQQARLDLATRAAKLGIWDWRLDSGEIEFSPRAREIWGFPQEGAVTQAMLSTAMHPEDSGEVQAQFARATDPDVRDVSAYEYRVITPEGARWVRAHGEAVFEPRGGQLTAVRYVGTMEDVTEARETQAALRASEARLKLAVEAGRMAVWEITPEGEVTHAPQLNRVLGLPEEARPTLPEIHARYYPGELERLQGLAEAAQLSGERYLEFEYRHLWPNDEVRWLAARAEFLVSPDGKPAGVIGVVLDITDRKQAELALTALNQSLEAEVAARTAERDRMWRISTELMLVADFEAAIQAVNPAWTRHLGYQPEELHGRKFLDLVHPDDVQSTLNEVGKLADGVTTFRFENRYRHKDGTYRWLSWTAVPEAGSIHAVARDVTEEKAAAEALQRTEQALRQAQKMEAVGQLTGGIAHDFNNMLAIVIGSLDLARRRLDRGEAGVERYLDSAREGASRAATLTQRLLAFSRQQPLSPRVLNVNRLVGDMSEMLRRTLGETIRLETVLAGGLWPVNADPHQLESAILNLAVNARDAMPEGGELTIETANTHLDEAYARNYLGLEPGQYVMVAVTDKGMGMPPDVVERVFDPFFTTKPVGKGTGLGLSMVYGFVKQSGGHVSIYSEVGVGTSMKIYLPRNGGLVEDQSAVSGSARSPEAGGTEVVLVVEDEERVRQVSVDALKELGYVVYEASGPDEALRVVESLARLDLLFTDVVMPGMSGRQLAERLQARAPRLGMKVLYTTGYTRNAVVHNGVLEPGVEFLPKPFSIADLAAKVRAVLDRQPVDSGDDIG